MSTSSAIPETRDGRRERAAERPRPASLPRRLLEASSLAVALYAFVAWVYVAVSAIVVPQTLHLPLWHLTRWPREDVFGSVSFGVSFVAFVTYRTLRGGGR